jgi:hypothetical protein
MSETTDRLALATKEELRQKSSMQALKRKKPDQQTAQSQKEKENTRWRMEDMGRSGRKNLWSSIH